MNTAVVANKKTKKRDWLSKEVRRDAKVSAIFLLWDGSNRMVMVRNFVDKNCRKIGHSRNCKKETKSTQYLSIQLTWSGKLN